MVSEITNESKQHTPVNVIKRDGKTEKLDINKIHKVLSWATEGLKNVSVSDIEVNAKLQLKDGIKTTDIHKVLVESAVGLITAKNPNYQFVASRLLNYYIRKETFGAYSSKEMPHLKDVIKKNVSVGVYDKEILDSYTANEIDSINDYIHHERDFNFAFAGIQQMVDKYVLKDRVNNKLYETPQYAFMVIAMVVFAKYPKETRIDYIRRLYNQISLFKINLPTPILCGIRTPLRQYSSCTLIDIGDSLESIFASNTAVGYYTAKRAGIGLNIGRIRAIGSSIRNGEVIHTGLIPYMKMFEATTKCTTQNGVRGGSSTTYYPFWHYEVEELLVLKNNKGNDENRIRKMDYGVQLCRLFYQRVRDDGVITLFSPSDVPGLYEAFGDNAKFEELYNKYEKDASVRNKKIKAREFISKLAQERLETGRIYVMNIDHCNSHSSFKDKIRMSNLCTEITLPTKPLNSIEDADGEIALCVLSAVNLGAIDTLDDLEETCELIVRTLDFVIEYQEYPVKAAEHMLGRRSIGVGFTNLAYYLAKNKVGYDKTSLPLVNKTAEAFQYYLLKASVKLAKEFGPCKYFDKTKYSEGILPIDTYCKNVDKIMPHTLHHDWEALRKDILQYGLRNSTLSTQMPCESSSVLNNSTNGIEPPRSLVSTKKSKQGLLRQVVPEVNKIGHHYSTAFEIENNGYLEMVSVIQKYFDQAMSVNNYYDFTKFEDGELPLSNVINDILYAYSLGIKTLYYANSNDGNIDTDGGCVGGACSV